MELPKLLFFTGRSAPSIPEKSKISDLDSQKFWESLFEMGGIQQEVIENQELLDYLEPILRADIKVVEKYQYEPLTEPLPVPIAIFGGLTDEDLSQESLDAWQKESTFPLEVSWVAGNHFFIFENPSQIIQELVKKSENC
jgi:surfactin synthase thioesterase subunit